MVNYPVGDFLIQIKNAALARNRVVEVEASNLVVAVAKVLKKEKILDEVKAKAKDKKLTVRLTYKNKEPFLLNLKLVSRPGLRTYATVDELTKRRGSSFLILTTPSGVMTDREAIKKGIGGEVIVEVW